MANVKISDLSLATTPLDGTELLPVVQSGVTRKTTTQDVIDLGTGIYEPALGFTPEDVANKSTNVVTDQSSNTKYPSVKAVYDWSTSAFEPTLGFTPEDVANKSIDDTLGGLTPSDTLYPSQKAVKEYVDNQAGGLPYKVYSALISNSAGTVTAQVLENTLGVTLNWTNPSNGIARGTAASGTPFTSNKTWISSGGYNNAGQAYIVTSQPRTAFPTTTIDFYFYLHDGTLSGTPNFTNFSIEIRVYN